jgi:hypothetical protein
MHSLLPLFFFLPLYISRPLCLVLAPVLFLDSTDSAELTVFAIHKWQPAQHTAESLLQTPSAGYCSAYFCPPYSRERVLFMVLDSVTSAPQWIRQPNPREICSLQLLHFNNDHCACARE